MNGMIIQESVEKVKRLFINCSSEEKYEVLIELGTQLKKLNDEHKNDANLISGLPK